MSILIVRNGQRWFVERKRICDVLAVNLRSYAWHLWDNTHEYCGHFETKAKLEQYIENPDAEEEVAL